MPSIIGSPVSAGASNQWPNLTPESSGSNRVHFVYVATEINGGTSDDMPATFSYNGVSYLKVIDGSVQGSFISGLTVFAAKESDIVTAEAGSGGVVCERADSSSVTAQFAFCVTVQDVNQSVDLAAIAIIAGPFSTSSDSLPHNISIPANTGEFVLVGARTSQGDSHTWTNITEVGDFNFSTSSGSIAAIAAASSSTILAGVAPDSSISYSTFLIGFALPSASASSNNDPSLDTPIPDISIQSNATGTVADISSNVSDADGDPLTYSVTPALPTGMTLNSSTGIVTADGSVTVTAAANYTFSADDGQGGTPATDVVSIEVTAVVNAGLRLTLRDAENSNALIASETGLTVHIYDTDGGTELLTTAAETTDASGVLEIDSDSIGNVSDTAFIVAKRSNGQTCCGTVTVIDLDA